MKAIRLIRRHSAALAAGLVLLTAAPLSAPPEISFEPEAMLRIGADQ